MDTPQPQRPARSATASQPPPTKHNDSRALEQWVGWAADNSVIAVTLITDQWVFTNRPHCSYSDRSLKVMLLANGSVRVLDTRSCAEHTFTGLSPEVAA